jgi:cysteine desulfurase
MGLPDWAKEGAVRIGLGRFNTEAEIEEAGDLLTAALGAVNSVRKYA